jgi:sugar phosphate isomerase/epimerase
MQQVFEPFKTGFERQTTLDTGRIRCMLAPERSFHPLVSGSHTMTRRVDRRGFVKQIGAIGAAVALADPPAAVRAGEAPKGTPNAEKLGWRVSCCAYTFNYLPLAQAVGKTASLGLKYIEGFAWQPLSKDSPNVQTNEAMPAAAREEMKKVLADHGVKMASCYLSELPNIEDVCRKKFDWGKEIGVEYFVAEPPKDAFDLLARLCDEYQIGLAVHNHPKPHSVYWNPQTVVEACHGRTKRIGACCDTGHWVRSGLDPVECLKKLDGRLIGFHLKDLADFGKVDSYDVPWGTGKANVLGILKEVKRQGAKPVFGIEYERALPEPERVRQVAECIAAFDKMALELAGA